MMSLSGCQCFRFALLLVVSGMTARGQSRPVLLESPKQLELRGVAASAVDYRGRAAIKVTETSRSQAVALAMLKGVAMQDGTIEAEVAGAPVAGAFEGARGFVGIAFRVQPEAKRFEYIYLRPTNGRAADQVRRNHSVQYAAHPDFPWERLRREEPEKYESYVDLEPGVFARIRIVVSGRRADLYVNGAAQPVLVVNDLKLGVTDGGVGLWVGPGTEAYFAQMRVLPGT